MPKQSWNVMLHGNLGCAVFDEYGQFYCRPLSQEDMAVLLVECLQTLRQHKIFIRPTHPIVVRRAEELEAGAEVELDELVPEPTEGDECGSNE